MLVTEILQRQRFCHQHLNIMLHNQFVTNSIVLFSKMGTPLQYKTIYTFFAVESVKKSARHNLTVTIGTKTKIANRPKISGPVPTAVLFL